MKNCRRRTASLLVCLVTAFLVVRGVRAADATTLTKVGDKCPVAAIRTTDGQNVALKGKVVVLNFFATWCGPCNSEMPHLEKDLWQPLKDQGVV